MVSAVADLNFLFDEMQRYQVFDRTKVAMQSVFGRTLGPKGNGRVSSGRDHHGAAGLNLVFGPNVKPGVAGGIKIVGDKDGGVATNIDSKTGVSIDKGDIAEKESLASACKTVLKVCGDAELMLMLMLISKKECLMARLSNQ